MASAITSLAPLMVCIISAISLSGSTYSTPANLHADFHSGFCDDSQWGTKMVLPVLGPAGKISGVRIAGSVIAMDSGKPKAFAVDGPRTKYIFQFSLVSWLKSPPYPLPEPHTITWPS